MIENKGIFVTFAKERIYIILKDMIRIRNIVLCGFLGSALLGFGWGQKGHDVVTSIAERHLTPVTRAKIDSMLDGKSIVYYANWLDNASHTPKYNYSRTWHYKNIDADQTFESAPTLQSGDVITALNREIAILQNPKQSAGERELALKMIIHLVGDMHQPLHLGHQSDRGGNNWKVKFFNGDTNLHTVWDSRLVESGHKWSYSEWVEQLDRKPFVRESVFTPSDIEKWAKESYGVCTEVYNKTPQGTKISYDYIADWTPTVEQQLLKGGLRLSEVLNYIFDPAYPNAK